MKTYPQIYHFSVTEPVKFSQGSLYWNIEDAEFHIMFFSPFFEVFGENQFLRDVNSFVETADIFPCLL